MFGDINKQNEKKRSGDVTTEWVILSQSIRNINMEAEINAEANSSDQPTTENLPKTNGEPTPETLAMPSPAKAR